MRVWPTPSPAEVLRRALHRHGDAVFAYALFLVDDDETARALQRAVFVDAHQALMLGGRLHRPRAWLLRAVRDTAGARHAAEELMVLRSVCGLGMRDACWVLGDEAAAARRVVRRGMRIGAGAGAAAAVAARASTARALAAQIPGFAAAGTGGVSHLVIASAVASTALVGSVAVTTTIEARSHAPHRSHPLRARHAPGATTVAHGDSGAATGYGHGRSTGAGGRPAAGRGHPSAPAPAAGPVKGRRGAHGSTAGGKPAAAGHGQPGNRGEGNGDGGGHSSGRPASHATGGARRPTHAAAG